MVCAGAGRVLAKGAQVPFGKQTNGRDLSTPFLSHKTSDGMDETAATVISLFAWPNDNTNR